MESRGRVSNQLVHVTDWLPTLAHIAGAEINETGLNGINLWDALSLNEESRRKEVLINIDEVIGYSSLVSGEWKYINGTTSNGIYDHWYIPHSNEANMNAEDIFKTFQHSPLSKYSTTGIDIKFYNEMRNDSRINCLAPLDTSTLQPCMPLLNPCLFNIIADPCEQDNLFHKEPEIVKMMVEKIHNYQMNSVKPRNKPSDLNSNPALYNNTWTWWFDEKPHSNVVVNSTSNHVLEFFLKFIQVFYN